MWVISDDRTFVLLCLICGLQGQRWSSNFILDDLLDRMGKAGLRANTHTHNHIILRHAEAQNLEMCLQCFAEMSEYNVSPSLKSAQGVIKLASGLGHARLALDLAYAFEASSVRKLEAQDWVHILAASTSCHFVRRIIPNTHYSSLTSLLLGKWCRRRMAESCC
jgi:pentatricopeptide repeat protein